MAYETEFELSLKQIIDNCQTLQNKVYAFTSSGDLKDLEEALYHAENTKILLDRVINVQNLRIKDREKVNA